MSTRRLVVPLVVLLVVFMVGTVVIALGQEDFEWGWWWAVPLGGGFLLAIVGFRLLVQRSQEAAKAADELADQQDVSDREQ